MACAALVEDAAFVAGVGRARAGRETQENQREGQPKPKHHHV
jgi:hypothetical protein